MLEIARKTLRARKSASVGTFIALLCATALITASGILAESGLRSSVDPHRYAGADAVVGGEQTLRLPDGDFTVSERLPEPVRLPAGLVGELETLDEVDTAVGDHHLSLAVAAPEGQDPLPVSGHGWDTAPLAPFAPQEGTAPGRAGEVALTTDLAEDLGVGPGETVQLVSGAVPDEYRVSGTVTHQNAGDGRGGSVFLHPEEADRLAQVPDAYDAIGIVAAPGVEADELDRAVESAAEQTPVTVHTGDAVNRIEFSEVDEARGLLLMISGSFGGLAVLISLFVVAGTLALSVNARRRELAVLRAIGSTPGQILRMLGAEALLLSLAAGLLGCLPGILVARAMHAAFERLGVLPPDLPLVIGPLPMVAAVLLITLASLIAGAAVALRPAWSNPVEAMRESSSPASEPPARWRGVAGMVCVVLAASVAMTPVALRNDLGAAGTSSAALLLVIAVALLGPVLLRPLVELLVRPLRRIRVSGFLAAESAGADLRRLGAVLTPLVLAVGFTLPMVHTQSVLAGAVSAQVEKGIEADAVVTDTGSGGVGPDVLEALAALPRTGALTPLQETRVVVPRSVFGDPELASFSAWGVESEGLRENLDPGLVEGDLDELTGATVAMERSGARLIGAEVGEEIDIRLGDGTPTTVRLVATYDRGLGLGEAMLPQEALGEHTGPPARILLSADEEAGPEELEAALGSFTERYPTLQLTNKDEFADGARAEADLAAWVNLIGLAVILGYIAIAVVNSLVMSTAARSREFALLRMIGATRRQVLSAQRWEACVIIVLAVLLGTVVAALPLAVLSLVFLGSPVPAGSPLVYLAVVALTALLGFCSVVLPARSALRTPPTEGIGAVD